MRPHLPIALLVLGACDQGVFGDDDTAQDTEDTEDTAPPCTTIDAIVTDIDETLTTDDNEFLQRIIDANHDEAMRPDADTLMQGYAAKGYAIVYLTARGASIPMAGGDTSQQVTEDWLTRHGFPFEAGRVFLADGIGALGSSAETYKAEVIGTLQDEGYVFHEAYGNAETDIAAYRDEAIPDEDLFLVGDLAGQMGVTGITNAEAYTAHLPFLDQVPQATCPDPAR